MSEEQVQSEVQEIPAIDIECSMCGNVGGPYVGCQLCDGNPRFIQKRHFSRTEELQGLNPDAKRRYGMQGEVGPKQVHGEIVLPKSANQD